MSSPNRTERVAGEIQAILADALRRDVKDPRITPITITRVRVAGDMGKAWVHFAPLGGGGDPKQIQQGLRAASGFLRRELGKAMSLRHVPELVFQHDDGIDDAVRLTSLLDRMEREDLAREAAEAAEPREDETP